MSNIIKNIEDWFSKEFKNFQSQTDKIAIIITQDVQAALDSGIVDGVASVVSAVFPSVKNIPEEVVTELKVVIPKLFAVELAIEGIPANATQDDITKFANAVMAAFKINDNKSKLYTTWAAQIYGILLKDTTKTFASLVIDVEQAYQDLVADQQNQ
jgi:hypothetical protein